jgi:hypothetical protein
MVSEALSTGDGTIVGIMIARAEVTITEMGAIISRTDSLYKLG